MPLKTLKEQLARCKHFTGVMNETCKAGVRYEDVKGPPPEPRTWGFSLPCLRECDTCDRREIPTDAEIEAEEREIERSFRMAMTARDAIVRHAGGQRGVSGSLPCPCCKGGLLRYSVAGSNGHIHAGCSTPDCVNWME